MDKPSVKLPIHEHPLFPSARSITGECDGCHVNEMMYSGYFCNEPYCYVWFHKECAEAPKEINHSFHPHSLLLTHDSGGDGPCVLCGKKLLSPCYSCPTCDQFKVDLSCGMKPSPPAIEHPPCHDHPLVFLKIREEIKVSCELCMESIEGPSYSCLECDDVYFHVYCVQLSKEVHHPCHSIHPLKLIASASLSDDAETKCRLCEETPENVLYHCSVCNFTSCFGCTKNPPPLMVEHIRTHKHPLTLFLRRTTCLCDVCGDKSDFGLYTCLQCDFITERVCIDIPRVININRHDHRIHFKHHLGVGYSECGVCHKNISQYKGAYACSVCPNYAVHSTCAVRTDVWDGVELEGTPEITERTAPFRVVGKYLIRHFSHKRHKLKLHKDLIVHDERICEACIHPVGFDSIYCCEKCPYILHQKCANLPMKEKACLWHETVYINERCGSRLADCKLCGILSYGFMYVSQNSWDVDVHCGSLNEPLVHDGHIHPLYFDKVEDHYCDGCGNDVDDFVLSCEECEFDLCLCCAKLPKKIWHRNDGHPLTLCCDEKEEETSDTKCWCDIFERELDPSIWFYTCSDCGVDLHAQCVLGDFSRLMPRQNFLFGEKEREFEVFPNNHNTRPICIQCHSRCKVSVIIKDCNEDNGYICSRSCLSIFLGQEI